MCLKNLARNKMISFIFDICHYVGENRSELLIFKHHNDRKMLHYLSKNTQKTISYVM